MEFEGGLKAAFANHSFFLQNFLGVLDFEHLLMLIIIDKYQTEGPFLKNKIEKKI